MAFLLLVKNRENLPKLVNLFVHHDITHIVLEYFKFKPFIVNTYHYPRLSSTPSISRRSSTTSTNYSLDSKISRILEFIIAILSQEISYITLRPKKE